MHGSLEPTLTKKARRIRVEIQRACDFHINPLTTRLCALAFVYTITASRSTGLKLPNFLAERTEAIRGIRVVLGLGLCVSMTTLLGTELPPPAKKQVGFDQHVKPILSAKCHACHGTKQQQSGLRLDKRQNALRGGDYGPVIIAGKSVESKLILRLVNGDGGMQMPPTGPLPAEDIGILRAWIDQGAKWGDIELEPQEPPKALDPKLKVLIVAVRGQDTAAVKKLLREAPELVKRKDHSDSTLLHHAAGFGNTETVKLLLDNGADVNAKNRLEGTSLHWAVRSEEKTGLLLEHGAHINSKTQDGSTPLYLDSRRRDSHSVLRLLLEKGADPNLATLNGSTPLMAAAGDGDVVAIKLLLAKGADATALNGSGSGTLMGAARSRNLEALRLLLEHRADVKVETKRKQTALAMAAQQGAEDIVKVLLENGAHVNGQDYRGYSPLMWAAYSEAMPAGIVKTLLEKGADAGVSGEGETPRTLAGKRGDNEVARLLGVSDEQRKSGGVTADVPLSAGEQSIPEAVQKAMALLEKQSPQFVKKGGCNSCHNQYLPSAAVALARDRGIPVPKELMQIPLELIERSPERTMNMAASSPNSLGYEMFGFAANDRPADEYTDSLVHYLKLRQSPNGHWATTGNRPPLTYDAYITTAMVVKALGHYSPPAESRDTEKRLGRAAQWLESAKPVTTQERAFHLLGLKWSGGDEAVIRKSARSLVETQREDGGWSQLPTMGSDAYATGEALYALHLAGKLKVGQEVYQKGMRYLLRTQAPDGSWHVKTRSFPLQPYFESGFPYGPDQWISASGTSWAAMALSLAVESKMLGPQ